MSTTVEIQLLLIGAGAFEPSAFEPSAFSEGDEWVPILDVTAAPIRLSRGFQSNAPGDLVSGPMTCSFQLDNSSHNSAALRGYYSPDSANVRAGFEIGIPVRVIVTANGHARTRFYGWIDSITPRAGLFDDLTCDIIASSWLAQAAVAPLVGLSTQINQRADQLVASLVGLNVMQPPATQYAAGIDVYPYALDNFDPATAVVLDALDATIVSGFDRLWEKADGTLVYENRWLRETTATNVITLSDVPVGGTPGLALTDLKAARSKGKITNNFVVAVHPRRVDLSPVILYQVQTSGTAALSIAPGETVVLQGQYADPNQLAQRVGGANMLIDDGFGGSTIGTTGFLPIADFDFGSSPGGTDLSPFMIVAVFYEAGQVTFTITNPTPFAAVVTKLQCRGIGLYDYQPLTSVAMDTFSQSKVGKLTMSIDCPYQYSPGFAYGAAQYGLNLFAQSQTHLDQGIGAYVVGTDEASMDALLALEISDPVGITETVSGLAAGNYWIDAVSEEYDERNNCTFTFALTPRDANHYFTLDVSTLDGPDVLAAI